jgi:hypothetical protein
MLVELVYLPDLGNVLFYKVFVIATLADTSAWP